MWWKKFDGSKFNGTRVDGDPYAPATTWWNVLWLKLFVWKLVATFQVDAKSAERGYRLGYKAEDGSCRLRTQVLHDGEIAVLRGRESCTFFAVDLDGNEVWLRQHWLTSKRRLPEHDGIRLV